MLQVTATPSSRLCLKELVVSNMRQAIDRFIGNQCNVASPAAIATVRATLRHKALAPKAYETVTTIAGLRSNNNMIDHCEGPISLKSCDNSLIVLSNGG